MSKLHSWFVEMEHCKYPLIRVNKGASMYSIEINEYLNKKNYVLSQVQMHEIQDHSCQLSIKLERIFSKNSLYHLWTSDGFEWNVWVENLYSNQKLTQF